MRELLDQRAQVEVANAQEAASVASERAGRAEKGAGEANERAARAQGSLALAEQHAAEANAKAEGFRADIAKANAASAQAQAQVAEAHRAAAEANKIAETERLARLQLEARLADRVITPDQRARITKAFLPMKGQTIDTLTVGDTPEVSRTADAIFKAISDAGVFLNFFHPIQGGMAQGVAIGIRQDAPNEARSAGTHLVSILQETLGGGAGVLPFEQVHPSGTGTTGHTPGAEAPGKSPLRLQVAPK